jgi:hypothetical protein
MVRPVRLNDRLKHFGRSGEMLMAMESGFSEELLAEVNWLPGPAFRVSSDAPPELSVYLRPAAPNLVVTWCFVCPFLLSHNLFTALIVFAVECFSRLYMDCIELRLLLPSTNNGVDVKRIKLKPVAPASGAFGGDNCSPRAQKRIENQISTGRAVLEGILDQRHGFRSWVESQEVLSRVRVRKVLAPG